MLIRALRFALSIGPVGALPAPGWIARGEKDHGFWHRDASMAQMTTARLHRLVTSMQSNLLCLYYSFNWSYETFEVPLEFQATCTSSNP